MAIKYIRTPTLQKTPIGGKADVFSIEDAGLAPKAPTSYTPAAGEKTPEFGTLFGPFEDFSCEYDTATGVVSLEKIHGESYNDAIFSGIPRGHFEPGYRSGSGYVMIGAFQGGAIGYIPSTGKYVKYRKMTWGSDTEGFPVVPSGTPFDIEVTETTLTVKHGTTTETVDISDLNIIYPSIGYGAVTSTLGSIQFTNLDAGSGVSSPDGTKYLRSDGKWKIPPTDAASFSSEFKTALLNCFRNVAWIGDNGMQFFNALSALLYSGETHDGWSNGVAYQNIGTVSGQKISSSNGSFTSASGWTRTVFVPCDGASRIVFPQLNETALQGDNAAFYNHARQRIAGIVLGLSAPKEVAVPEGAAYFAISSEDSALATCISNGIIPYA